MSVVFTLRLVVILFLRSLLFGLLLGSFLHFVLFEGKRWGAFRIDARNS